MVPANTSAAAPPPPMRRGPPNTKRCRARKKHGRKQHAQFKKQQNHPAPRRVSRQTSGEPEDLESTNSSSSTEGSPEVGAMLLSRKVSVPSRKIGKRVSVEVDVAPATRLLKWRPGRHAREHSSICFSEGDGSKTRAAAKHRRYRSSPNVAAKATATHRRPPKVQPNADPFAPPQRTNHGTQHRRPKTTTAASRPHHPKAAANNQWRHGDEPPRRGGGAFVTDGGAAWGYDGWQRPQPQQHEAYHEGWGSPPPQRWEARAQVEAPPFHPAAPPAVPMTPGYRSSGAAYRQDGYGPPRPASGGFPPRHESPMHKGHLPPRSPACPPNSTRYQPQPRAVNNWAQLVWDQEGHDAAPAAPPNSTRHQQRPVAGRPPLSPWQSSSNRAFSASPHGRFPSPRQPANTPLAGSGRTADVPPGLGFMQSPRAAGLRRRPSGGGPRMLNMAGGGNHPSTSKQRPGLGRLQSPLVRGVHKRTDSGGLPGARPYREAVLPKKRQPKQAGIGGGVNPTPSHHARFASAGANQRRLNANAPVFTPKSARGSRASAVFHFEDFEEEDSHPIGRMESREAISRQASSAEGVPPSAAPWVDLPMADEEEEDVGPPQMAARNPFNSPRTSFAVQQHAPFGNPLLSCFAGAAEFQMPEVAEAYSSCSADVGDEHPVVAGQPIDEWGAPSNSGATRTLDPAKGELLAKLLKEAESEKKEEQFQSWCQHRRARSELTKIVRNAAGFGDDEEAQE